MARAIDWQKVDQWHDKLVGAVNCNDASPLEAIARVSRRHLNSHERKELAIGWQIYLDERFPHRNRV